MPHTDANASVGTYRAYGGQTLGLAAGDFNSELTFSQFKILKWNGNASFKAGYMDYEIIGGVKDYSSILSENYYFMI